MAILSDCHLEVVLDQVDKTSWDHLLNHFEDASISQTWEMGSARNKKGKLSHITLKRGEDILALCQVRLRTWPLLKIGFADIVWGPLCVKKEKPFEPNVLVHLIRAIKDEYAIKRGYLLRVWPNAVGDRKELLSKILESENFSLDSWERPYRTFKLDLSPPLEELRKNFLQKWRNCLNKAEKCNLNIVQGTNDELFKIFLRLAKEMFGRKSINESDNYQIYQQVQKVLPPHLKMQIMICESDGEPVNAIICSALGDTGIYQLGAMGNKGFKVNGAYLLHWKMIQWLKNNGFRYYDLGAFNPQINPNVYHFKKGLAGKKGGEEIFLGKYVGCFSLRNKIVRLISSRHALMDRLDAFKHGHFLKNIKSKL